MFRAIRKFAVIAAMAGTVAGVFTASAHAQADTQTDAQSKPQDATPAGPTPIRLAVDATQAPQKILHAHMTIPVQAGPLTLFYPEWIPGEHMPDGPIINVTGMKFTAGNQLIPWRRDLVEMFSIHLDVPAGVTSLEADLDFLLSAPAGGFSAELSARGAREVRVGCRRQGAVFLQKRVN